MPVPRVEKPVSTLSGASRERCRKTSILTSNMFRTLIRMLQSCLLFELSSSLKVLRPENVEDILETVRRLTNKPVRLPLYD
jgi:hypothetical protein